MALARLFAVMASPEQVPDALAVFRARSLSKTYLAGDVAVPALREVDFDIYRGEFLVLLGPSGSGKSTLLNIVGGLERASGGSLFYEDHELSAADAQAQKSRQTNPLKLQSESRQGTHARAECTDAPKAGTVPNLRQTRVLR